MNFISENDAMCTMNDLGHKGIPFIFVCSYDKSRCLVLPLSDVDKDEMRYYFKGMTNSQCLVRNINEFDMSANYPSFDEYKRGFDIVKEHLIAGNCSLVNYTCKVPVKTHFTLLDIYNSSEALFKLYIKDKLVCFSPEIFVRINKRGEISSYPMKGTIDATLPSAEQLLMNDEKEQREHADVVKLITSDISRVAQNVHTRRYRYVDKIKTSKGCILETSSEIVGQLSDDYCSRIGSIIFSQLPAGSITGAPKGETIKVIEESENYSRDFYTGVMGYFSDGVLESGVMIRFIDVEDGNMYFKAGGGITALSDCRREYEEVKAKVYVPLR